MNLDQQFDKVLYRYDEVRAQLSQGDGLDSQNFVRLSKELAEMEPIVDSIQALNRAKDELAQAADMIADPDLDPEMKALAEEEFYRLKDDVPRLNHDIRLLLLPKDEADEKNAILEVRAGTGGEEAALFAAQLFRMYERYAALKGWRFEVLDSNDTEIGGMKEASATITGRGVFARFKFPKPKPADAFTPRRPRWRCCPKRKKWISSWTIRICALTCTARKARAGKA